MSLKIGQRVGEWIARAALTIAMMAQPQVHAARPADPWPGPSGEFIFIEAEAMTVRGQGWGVEDASRFNRTGCPSSLKSLGGERAGNGNAMQKIVGFVDRAGDALAHDPLRDHYMATQLTDEATAPPLASMIGQPAHEAAFVRWLRERGAGPRDLGLENWEQVKLTPDRAGPHPALYSESERFRAWSIAHFFQQATAMVRKAFPASALSTQNFSDGAVFSANFYGQGNDYFTWFRNQALDLAWSEDWTNVSSTYQLCGWNVALLRAATRKHGQPIGMYVISSHPTPLDVKLKAYSDMGQGAKILDIFSYTTPYLGHERSWYQNAPKYAVLAELTREIGAAEDVLLGAQPRDAETAIIYSRAYDIWNVNQDNIEGHERMHTYLALRHAQVAVDVLDEEDVAAGELKGRRVAYLFGEQLDRAAVEPLIQWVRDGGTLVLAPGAGSRDQLNRPDNTIDQSLGLARGPLQRLQKYWNASRNLGGRGLASKGKVQLVNAMGNPAHSADYFALVQGLTAHPGDRVLAGFIDSKPAALSHSAGKGRVIAMGFLPAISYIRGALADRELHLDDPVTPLDCVTKATAVQAGQGSIPLKSIARKQHTSMPPASSFEPALRDLLTWAVRSAGVRQPVETDLPLIEATFMEGPAGWVVPLANYSGSTAGRLTVTLRVGERLFGEVRSSRQGLLKTEIVEKGVIRIVLPVESTDMIYARWHSQKVTTP